MFEVDLDTLRAASNLVQLPAKAAKAATVANAQSESVATLAGLASVAGSRHSPAVSRDPAVQALIDAAMRACDYWGDDAAAREQMVRDCLETPPEQRDALHQHFERAYSKAVNPRDQ